MTQKGADTFFVLLAVRYSKYQTAVKESYKGVQTNQNILCQVFFRLKNITVNFLTLRKNSQTNTAVMGHLLILSFCYIFNIDMTIWKSCCDKIHSSASLMTTVYWSCECKCSFLEDGLVTWKQRLAITSHNLRKYTFYIFIIAIFCIDWKYIIRICLSVVMTSVLFRC